MASNKSLTPSSPIGSLPRDGNGIAVQAGSQVGFADNTGTPLQSPQTVTASTTTIVVPNKAVEFVVFPTGADIDISDTSGFTGYDLIKNGSKEVFGCANLLNIYLRRDAGTNATVYFHFTLLT